MTTPTTPEPSEMEGWLLVVDEPVVRPDAAPDRRPWIEDAILGLPVVLRLALTAQAAGARALALSEAAAVRKVDLLLTDDRVRIPVLHEADRPSLVEFRVQTLSVRVPANTVIHRATLLALKERADEGEVSLSFSGAPRGAGGPYGFEPIFVDGADSAHAAERALLRSLRKPQDGWASTHLNRRISLFLTRWLVSTRLTPNQVSVGILAVGLVGAWLASRGTYASMLGGAALFQAQSVLDGCDGEMSRLTFRGSRKGEWLDTIGDDLTNYAFFAGAAWGLYAATGHAFYLALGAITVASGIIGSGLEYRYLIRIGSGDLLKYPLGIGKAKASDAPGPSSPLARALDAISPLFKRDTFVLLTLVGAALGWLGPFLVAAAFGAVGVLAAVVGAEVRMSRERRQARPQGRAAPVDPVVPRD